MYARHMRVFFHKQRYNLETKISIFKHVNVTLGDFLYCVFNKLRYVFVHDDVDCSEIVWEKVVHDAASRTDFELDFERCGLQFNINERVRVLPDFCKMHLDTVPKTICPAFLFANHCVVSSPCSRKRSHAAR